MIESNSNAVTYLPFHLSKFWNDFYTSKGIETFNWYFDLTKLEIPEFNYKQWSKESELLLIGSGTSSFLDYLNSKDIETVTLIDFSTVLVEKLKDKYPKWEIIGGDISNNEETTDLSEDSFDYIIDKGCLDCLLSDPDKAEERFITAMNRIVRSLEPEGVFFYFSTGKPEERANLLFKIKSIKYQISVIDLNIIFKEEWKDFNQGDNIYYLYRIIKVE